MGKYASPEELGMSSDSMVAVGEEKPEPEEFAVVEKEPDLEIEIVDDTPEADKKYVSQPPAKTDAEKDEEIEDLGGRAQKRIAELTRQRHDERREKERYQRELDELTAHTKRVLTDSQRKEELLKRTQEALNVQATKRAEQAIKSAKINLHNALESGNTEAISAAQEELTNATMAKQFAPQVARQYAEKWASEQASTDKANEADAAKKPESRPEPVVPKPNQRTLEWHKENPWFGEDRVMTSTALGIHEQLVVEEGVEAESEEYWSQISTRLSGLFPDKFAQITEASPENGAAAKQTASQPAAKTRVDTVVAPAMRNNGAKPPRKITLTESEVRIAKRLGLTVKQYAEQKLKEQSANG